MESNVMTQQDKDAVLLAFELARKNNDEQRVIIGGYEYSIRPVKPGEPWD
jgi:hypothetical protein